MSEPTYTTSQVCRAIGATSAEVNNWIKTGKVELSLPTTTQGKARKFDRRGLFALTIARHLARLGMLTKETGREAVLAVDLFLRDGNEAGRAVFGTCMGRFEDGGGATDEYTLYSGQSLLANSLLALVIEVGRLCKIAESRINDFIAIEKAHAEFGYAKVEAQDEGWGDR